MKKNNKRIEYSKWKINRKLYIIRFIKGEVFVLLFSYLLSAIINSAISGVLNFGVSFLFFALVFILSGLYLLFLYLHYYFKVLLAIDNHGQHGNSIVHNIDEYKFSDKYDRNNINTWDNIDFFDISSTSNKSRGIPIGTIAKENQYGYEFVISHKTEDMAKVVGATGSGKTQTVLCPLIDILSIPQDNVEQESMLITDPKGELYKKMSPILKDRGYDVYIQNTLDPVNSNKINTLSIIAQTQEKIDKLLNGRSYKNLKDDEKEEYANLNSYKNKQINSIAKIFTDDPSAKEKIWSEASYSTLVGFIHFTLHFLSESKKVKEKVKKEYEPELTNQLLKLVKDFDESSKKDKNLIKEINLLNEQLNELKNSFDKENFEPLNFTSMTIKMQELLATKTKSAGGGESTELDDIFNTLDVYHPARLANSTSNVSGGNTKSSILMSLLNSLSIFFDTSVASMSCANDIDFFALDEGKPKAIFCVVPDDDKSRHKITSIFIEIIYSTLREISRGKKNGELNRRFNFILEEVANVCDILNFSEKLSVARGSNIRFTLALQGDKQLEKKYGKEESDIISANCRLKLMILSNDVDEWEKFSKSAGKQTVEIESLTYAKDNAVAQTRQSSLQEKEIITNTELREMQFTELFVELIRYPTLRGTLPPFFTFEHIKKYNVLEKIDLPEKNLIDVSEIEILKEFSDKDFVAKLTKQTVFDKGLQANVRNVKYGQYNDLLEERIIDEINQLLNVPE